MKKWKCSGCGYIHDGEEVCDTCPKCGAKADKFEALDQAKADLIERSRLEDFLFLCGGHVVDLPLVLLRVFLNFFLCRVAFVFAQNLVFLGLVGVLLCVAANVADGDAGFFGKLLQT